VEHTDEHGRPTWALVRAIVYQQLAGAAAAAIHGRLVAALGGEVEPGPLAALSDETLRAVGMSRSKVLSLRDLRPRCSAGGGTLRGRRGQRPDAVGRQPSAEGTARCKEIAVKDFTS
jgi:DNA-3-methyladenine glycosylase II